MMRAVIDTARCTGHGRCYDIAPELFSDDAGGFGQLVGDGKVAPRLLTLAQRAVTGCPEGAISLVEGGD